MDLLPLLYPSGVVAAAFVDPSSFRTPENVLCGLRICWKKWCDAGELFRILQRTHLVENVCPNGCFLRVGHLHCFGDLSSARLLYHEDCRHQDSRFFDGPHPSALLGERADQGLWLDDPPEGEGRYRPLHSGCGALEG